MWFGDSSVYISCVSVITCNSRQLKLTVVAHNKFKRICSSNLFFSFVFEIYVPGVTLVIVKTASIVIKDSSK